MSVYVNLCRSVVVCVCFVLISERLLFFVITENIFMPFQYCSAVSFETKSMLCPRIRTMFRVSVSIGCLLLPVVAVADEIDRFPVKPTEQQYQEAVQQFETLGFRPSREEKTLFVSKPDVTDTQLAMVPNLPFSFGLALAAVPVTDAG
ncbi:MAG: hypothetical protein DWH78_02265, partial [Planctomycetota bacterium]